MTDPVLEQVGNAVSLCPARLKKRSDFLFVAGGRKSHSALFTVQVRPRINAPGGSRVGLTVTKKVGSAVERNRIKRRLRAALLLEDLGLPAAHDCVIVARRPLLSAPFADIGRGLRVTAAKALAGARSRK